MDFECHTLPSPPCGEHWLLHKLIVPGSGSWSGWTLALQSPPNTGTQSELAWGVTEGPASPLKHMGKGTREKQEVSQSFCQKNWGLIKLGLSEMMGGWQKWGEKSLISHFQFICKTFCQALVAILKKERLPRISPLYDLNPSSLSIAWRTNISRA